MQLEMDYCPNCGEKGFGNYCSNCGQKRVIVPISRGTLASSFLDLIDFNRGFFFTLFSLLLKPGELIGNYLAGKTRNYNNPVRLLSTTIAFLVAVDIIRSWGTDNITSIELLRVVGILFIYSLLYNKIVYHNKFLLIEYLVVTLYQVTAIYFILAFTTFFFLSLESLEILSYSDILSTSIGFVFVIPFLVSFYYKVIGSSLKWAIVKSVIYLLGIPSIALLVRGVMEFL